MTHILDRIGDGPGKRWLALNLDHADREFCLIWPFAPASNGYGQFGKSKHIPHRIMCEHRHGPAPSDGHQAAHSCGNGHLGCVNPNHLNWKTPAENQLERYEHSGVEPRAKLTPAQVEEIRGLAGKEVKSWTAERFGVSEANIRQIQSGKTWQEGGQRNRPLTEEEVRLIRATPKGDKIEGAKTAIQLAQELGVTISTITNVRCGYSYKWVA